MNLGYDGVPGSFPQGDAKIREQILGSVNGYLRAWDPVAQKEVWSVQQPGPWDGGILSTAGGLVFEGNAMGLIGAFDAKTGKPLWSNPAQTGVIAAPMSYMANGEQYIAVVAGWGGVYPLVAGDATRKGSINVNRSRVLAFKLGGTAKLPEEPKAADVKPLPRVGCTRTVNRVGALAALKPYVQQRESRQNARGAAEQPSAAESLDALESRSRTWARASGRRAWASRAAA